MEREIEIERDYPSSCPEGPLPEEETRHTILCSCEQIGCFLTNENSWEPGLVTQFSITFFRFPCTANLTEPARGTLALSQTHLTNLIKNILHIAYIHLGTRARYVHLHWRDGLSAGQKNPRVRINYSRYLEKARVNVERKWFSNRGAWCNWWNSEIYYTFTILHFYAKTNMVENNVHNDKKKWQGIIWNMLRDKMYTRFCLCHKKKIITVENYETKQKTNTY